MATKKTTAKANSTATKAVQRRTNDQTNQVSRDAMHQGERPVEHLPEIQTRLGVHSGITQTPLYHDDIPSSSPQEAFYPKEAQTVLDGSGKLREWYDIPVDRRSDAHMANIVEGNADTANGPGFRKVPRRMVQTPEAMQAMSGYGATVSGVPVLPQGYTQGHVDPRHTKRVAP